MALNRLGRGKAARGSPSKRWKWIVWIASAAILLAVAGYFALQPRQTRFSLTEMSPSADPLLTYFRIRNDSGFDVGDHLAYCQIRAAYSPATLIADSHSKKMEFPRPLRNGESEVISCLKPAGYAGLPPESGFYCVDVVVHLEYSLDERREDFAVRRVGMVTDTGLIWTPRLLGDPPVCKKRPR
jgi:hypothetical protein